MGLVSKADHVNVKSIQNRHAYFDTITTAGLGAVYLDAVAVVRVQRHCVLQWTPKQVKDLKEE